MASLSEFLGSSSSLLLVCMGVSMTIGLLHLWMSGRRWDSNWWIALWSMLACAFLGARGIQLTTTDPEAALYAGRSAIAIGPFLVWAIIGFTADLNESKLPRGTHPFLCGIASLWALGIIATPFFVDPQVSTRSDLFGSTHYAVHARWPTLLLGAYVAGVFAWGFRRLRTSTGLDQKERRVVLAGLFVYAAMAIQALLSSTNVVAFPAVAEYGPFVVAVSLSYLLVHRRRRLEGQLEALLVEKTSLLAASEERYRDLIDHAPLGVFACNTSGDITTLNHQMARMTHTPFGTVAFENIDRFQPIAESGLPATIREALSKDHVVRRKHRYQAPEGRRLDLQVTASPLHDQHGISSGVLVLAEDVTERGTLERQLRQSQKMESIGQLTAGIAHEINNPMAFVRANLSTMENSWEALRKELRDVDLSKEALSEVQDFDTLIEESMEGVERTIAVVQDMREFAHSGDEERGETDLREIIEGCVRIGGALGREEAAIEESYGEDLRVVGAKGPLRQVFLNLLVNALQAGKDSAKVWIEAERQRNKVIVRVHDNGPGVAEEARARLFDPFFTTKDVGEGTGLGLYISYQIVRNHGGELRNGDSPHGGALFEVELPALQN